MTRKRIARFPATIIFVWSAYRIKISMDDNDVSAVDNTSNQDCDVYNTEIYRLV